MGKSIPFMLGWLASAILCVGGQPMFGQAQKNVAFVGELSYSIGVNDVWGYVDTAGNEYALVGLVEGVSIVDLADSTNPQELFYLPGAETGWRDLKTFQNYAYVCNEGDSGILVIDLAGLPDTVHYRDTVIAGMITAHNIWIDEFGFLYMVGGNAFAGGIAIYDLNPDPWTPTFVGFYDERYVHDIYVRDNLAYLAEIFNGQLTILDVSDKSDPQILGTHSYTGGFTHNTWLNDAGDVCFTTDEYNGASLIAWDVSDPMNIQELDRIRSSVSKERAAPHNVHVLNDYLMTAYYQDGLHITDAHRPGNLIEVGYYDTSELDGGGFRGSWGAYPFLPSGLVLMSDREEGLIVLRPTFVRGCYLEGDITDKQTGAAVGGTDVAIQDTLGVTVSELSGAYAAGVADSGLYQVVYSRYGYVSDTLEVLLDHGMVTELDVELTPSPRVDFTIRVLEAGSMQPIEGAEIRAEVEAVEELFVFQSNLDGEVNDPRFVIDTYQMIVGKWGYVTQEMQVVADSSQPSVTFLLEPGYYDDFALDFGWTVEGNPRNGNWERGEPIGTYETFFNWGIFNPEFDLPDDIGDQAYVTGNRGGSAFSYDVDRGFTRLVSPPIDLRLYQHPRITYYYWFVNWSLINQGQIGNDFYRVSITDGVDTFIVQDYIGPFDTTWTQAEIRVEEYFPPDREVRVMFYTQDFEAGNQDAVEAGLDGFRVEEWFPLAAEDDWESSNWDLRMHASHPSLELNFLNTIPSSLSSYHLEIYSLAGNRLLSTELNPRQRTHHLPFHYPAGMYIARLTGATQSQGVKRFLKLE
ncbi:MAG: choice-of-anchor B family protein [Bacteroidota bacterium]